MMMISYFGAVFLSIWLVAGMAEWILFSVVGSIASFVNYLSQIIFFYYRYGRFWGIPVTRAMISSSYSS